jgi:hypothetical protein
VDKEQSRVKAEIKKVSAEVAELMENMNANQNNIYQASEKMERIRNQLNWNQQQLSEWLEKAKVVEEDSQALEKYSRADEAKIKDMSLNIERLMQELSKAKRLLDAEVTETHVNRVALEKVALRSPFPLLIKQAADNFQRIHRERQEVIALWEQTLVQMQKRDEEIEQHAKDLGQLKSDAVAAQISLNEQLEFLKQEEVNNSDAEKLVDAAGLNAMLFFHHNFL